MTSISNCSCCFQHPQPRSRNLPMPTSPGLAAATGSTLPLHISWGSDLPCLHGHGALWSDILTTKKKHHLNIPLLKLKVDPSWQFHTETPELKFLSPSSLSHSLQGLHRLHIPEGICCSQSAPAVPCLLPAPANRGDNPKPTPSHRVLPYSSKRLLCAGCSITGCSYKYTTLSDGRKQACSSKYFSNEVAWSP